MATRATELNSQRINVNPLPTVTLRNQNLFPYLLRRSGVTKNILETKTATLSPLHLPGLLPKDLKEMSGKSYSMYGFYSA